MACDPWDARCLNCGAGILDTDPTAPLPFCTDTCERRYADRRVSRAASRILLIAQLKRAIRAARRWWAMSRRHHGCDIP